MTTESSETDVKGPKRTDGLGAFDSESEFYFNGRRTKPSNGAYPFPNGAGFPIPGFNINSRYPYFNPVGERGPGYGAFGNPTKYGGSSSASSAASQSFSNGGFSGSSSNAASQSFSNGVNRYVTGCLSITTIAVHSKRYTEVVFFNFPDIKIN
ncbi:hypothetical protein RUM43_003374 [Polyplax serrata]|uniref:Uncharacterized protein n=1 Tax=Polyplax serrata TaxID=468196 RepID=A0AAN8S5I2_POLSC